jgi:hypothetical protein
VTATRSLADVVDLDRYPIDAPGSTSYAQLVERCRGDLAARGASVLDGFARPDAVARILAAIEPKEPLAFHKVKQHNVYLDADDPGFAADHARNAKQTTTSATLGHDRLRDVVDLETLYGSDELRGFVADALGYPELYPYADEVSGVNVLYYPLGTSLGWHFDNAAFTSTLMIREAEAGAAFEFAPFLRTDDDPGYDAVAAVVAGETGRVQRLHQGPGTLVLFRGSRTLHRVTAVEGRHSRLLVTMTFAPEPGVELSAINQATFYGRARPS